ncbi:hypothetical protein Ddye_008089 [Dipteronia dyeriana]|uniref:Uncharacterized protein n=1 Tax=Dipteronia dyeriana TaxID=168575 RepID=A0AAD9X955_9ROSI|nr:hypothetical protein Ddye_008089 [Dipteronia dyeriana]
MVWKRGTSMDKISSSSSKSTSGSSEGNSTMSLFGLTETRGQVQSAELRPRLDVMKRGTTRRNSTEKLTERARKRMADKGKDRAIGNLLEMETKYEGKMESYKKLKQKKAEVGDILLLAQGKYESLKDKMIELNVHCWKGKTDRQKNNTKLYDFRWRIEAANMTIRGMKDDMGDNAIDLFLASDEFYDIQTENFDPAI